jgi:hypothetical protein
VDAFYIQQSSLNLLLHFFSKNRTPVNIPGNLYSMKQSHPLCWNVSECRIHCAGASGSVISIVLGRQGVSYSLFWDVRECHVHCAGTSGSVISIVLGRQGVSYPRRKSRPHPQHCEKPRNSCVPLGHIWILKKAVRTYFNVLFSIIILSFVSKSTKNVMSYNL